MKPSPPVAGFSALALVGLLIACDSGPVAPTVIPNRSPGGGSVSVTPNAVGMAGLTTFAFDSNASDADSDPLTYSWNFGDGATGTGKTPTHIYMQTGTFDVTLSVSDGKETVFATGLSVTVASVITGTWRGGRNPYFPSSCVINFTATQDGDALTGSINFSGCSNGPTVTLASGSVFPSTHPSTVTWLSNTFTFVFTPTIAHTNLSLRFTGTTNAAGNILNGTTQVLQDGIGGPRIPIPTTFTK